MTRARSVGRPRGHRGRPLHLPEDTSAVNGSTINCETRIAWLLITNRILRPDVALARREGFISRLADGGVVLDAPRMSRLESGTATVPSPVVGGYEELLGLAPGSLLATVTGLRRAFGPTPAASPRATHEGVAELDELLSIAYRGQATGADWLQAATALQHYEHVFLRHDDWTKLCTNLIRELATAIGSGYVRRFEAAAALLAHPRAQRHLSMALGNFVMDPDTQVVTPVLALLAEVTDQAASDLVLRLLNSPSKYLYRAASSVAAAKLARGHFGDRALPALEEHVARRLVRGLSVAGGLDALDLAHHLPPESWGRVERRLRDPEVQALVVRARATRELIPSRQATARAAGIATKVQEATPGHYPVETDMMLRRLIRESLFHAHKARRHHAALLLAASPYAPAAAEEVYRLTSDGNDDFVAARAWSVLMRLPCVGAVGAALERNVVDVSNTHAARALINVGLHDRLPSQETTAALLPRLATRRDSERHAVLFALGMHASPELVPLVDHPNDAVSRGASWWLLQGGATRDHDAGPATPEEPGRDGLAPGPAQHARVAGSDQTETMVAERVTPRRGL
jgi:hypothetical protein